MKEIMLFSLMTSVQHGFVLYVEVLKPLNILQQIAEALQQQTWKPQYESDSDLSWLMQSAVSQY